jgi:hypothetical protein
MKIVTIDGEVWFLSSIDDIRPIKGLSLIDVVMGVAKKYAFATAPNTIPKNDDGLVFEEGHLKIEEKTIPIKKLTLFNDGTHIVVPSSTDDADIVLKDLRDWGVSIGGRSDVQPILHYHASTIVCDFDHSIDHLVSGFETISSAISAHLDIPHPVHNRLLSFTADPLSMTGRGSKINPTLFRIEPRAHIEFASRRYFSVANMTTDNHIRVLTMLDEMCGAPEDSAASKNPNWGRF